MLTVIWGRCTTFPKVGKIVGVWNEYAYYASENEQVVGGKCGLPTIYVKVMK